MSLPQSTFSRAAALRELPGILVTTLREGRWFVLVSAVKEAKYRVVPIVIAWLGAQIISGLPAVVQQLPGAFKKVTYYIIASTVVTLLNSLLTTVVTYAEDRYGAEFEIALTARVRRAQAYLPFYQYEDRDTLDAFERAERFAGQLKSFVQDMVLAPLSVLIMMVIAIRVFISVSSLLTILALAAFVPIVMLRLRISRERDSRWDAFGKLYRLKRSYENLLSGSALKETRLLNMVPYVFQEWRRYSLEHARFDQTYNMRRQKLDVADDTLRSGFLVATLLLTLRAIFRGLRPIGDFMYIQSIAEQYLLSLSSFVYATENIDTFLRQLTDYVAVMKLPVFPEKSSVAIAEPSIVFDHVSFSYPRSSELALRDMSLAIPFGSTVAIVGENGAGKTTLVKLLMGLYRPTAGSITVNGAALDTLDHAAYARSLGVLFQDFQSYEDFTVRDAVWFGDVEKPRTDEAIYTALERAGAREFVEKLPQKLGSYMSAWMDKDNGSDLSGGQRQRIAIARTLFRDPDILIMDEPTSAIDAKAEYEIFKELEANRRGKTTILISHRFSTVRKADTIIVLSKGCSIEAGSHRELMERRGVYYDLFTKQAEGYK